MHTLNSLLAAAAADGVEVLLRADTIHLKGANRNAWVARLRPHRTAILAALRQTPATAQHGIPPERLDAIFEGYPSDDEWDAWRSDAERFTAEYLAKGAPRETAERLGIGKSFAKHGMTAGMEASA